MKYFLAIDQGGSKTEALIFSQKGEILAFADDRDLRVPGESYYSLQGRWIRYAAEKALEKAELPMSSLAGACCSLNGADWPSDYDRLRKLVSNELGLDEKDIRIVNDCIGAMRGAASGGNQAVLCAGTGMNCAVRAADGREHIYGYFVNPLDQGGGALGTQTWQSILDAYTGIGPETLLSQLILERYGETDLVELYKKFTTNQLVFKNYDLSPLLMRAAKKGDAVACKILETAANRMVSYIEKGAQQIGLEQEPITLVLTGGVFKGDGDVFYQTIERNIQRRNLNFVCSGAQYEPVAGAALLLLDELAQPERDAALKRFDEDAPRFNMKWGTTGLKQ